MRNYDVKLLFGQAVGFLNYTFIALIEFEKLVAAQAEWKTGCAIKNHLNQ